MLNIVQHTPQHLQEMLSGGVAKAESLHEVTTVTVDRHQVRSTILENFEAMKVYIGRPRALEICRLKLVDLKLIKACKKGYSLTRRIRDSGKIAAHLKLRKGSEKWTYQENIKGEMGNHDLRRINSRGRNKKGGWKK